jgi:hypothetical protein
MIKKTVLFIASLCVPALIYSVCPLCVIAAGAGVGFSRWLAIDDLITGLWIGGLLLATSLWLIKIIRNTRFTFKFYPAVIFILTYGSTIWLLYWYQIIGQNSNTIYGFDRLVFGVIIGSCIFMLGVLIHAFIKVGFGRILFRFQKIIIPITILIIASLLAQMIL